MPCPGRVQGFCSGGVAFAVRQRLREDRERERADQPARQVVGADIDRVERQREREQHHLVLRTGREGNDHVGGTKRQQQHHQRGKAGRRGDGDRERSDRGAEIVEHRAPAGVGEARARDRAEHDHRAAAEPPRQDRVHPAGAVQDRGTRHRAEQQPAGEFDPAQEHRQRGRYCDQDREFGQRRAARRLRRADHRGAGKTEQREAARQPDHDQQHAHHLDDGDAAHIGLELGSERDDLRHRARRRSEEGRGPVPAVDKAQIGSGRGDHGDGRNRQHRDAERVGCHAL